MVGRLDANSEVQNISANHCSMAFKDKEWSLFVFGPLAETDHAHVPAVPVSCTCMAPRVVDF